MPEGSFPKSIGDVLFASEVNLFNPKAIDKDVTDSNLNISGTNIVQVIKTVSYTANPAISKFFLIDYLGIAHIVEAQETQLRISGTAGIDFVIDTQNTVGNSRPQVMSYHNFVTSGNITASGGNIGSPYDFIIEGRSNNNTTSFITRDLRVIGW